MIAAFALLRTIAVVDIAPVRTPDSPSHLRFDLAGTDMRPWTVPLLFNLMPSDPLRVAAQVAIAVAGWGALGVAVARACRHPVSARIAAGTVLVLGLCVQVTQWDLAVLSESVTLSLTAMGAAAVLWALSRRADPAALSMVLGVVLLWTFARYVNAMALAVAFPAAAALLFWRLPRRRALLATGALALTAAWGVYVVSLQDFIWRVNAFHILVERVLRDPEATRHFTDRGLVVTPALRRETREYMGPEGPAFTDPAFQKWLGDRWRRSYASYLATHPIDTLADPIREAPALVSADPAYTSPRAVLPAPVQETLWDTDRGSAQVLVLAGLATLLWLLSLRRGPPSRAELSAWALVALGVLWLELIWNFAARELQRLNVPPGMALRLGFVLLAVFTVDRLLTVRREGYPLRSGPDSSAG